MGGELIQDNDGSLYEDQLNTYVFLMDFVTLAMTYFGHPIHRQIPVVGGDVISGVLPRADEKGSLKGSDLCGLFAHHHNTSNRGDGDCGIYPFSKLRDAGYECFDVNRNEDRDVWRQRQVALGLTGKDVDGLPGKKTSDLIRAKRSETGLWIARPNDSAMLEAIKKAA